MQRLRYLKAHNLMQITDELAVLPALAPVPDVADPNDLMSVFQVEGSRTPDEFFVTVPDKVNRRLIDAVVNAHVADPNYGVETPVTRADIRAMNLAQLREFVAKRLGDG